MIDEKAAKYKDEITSMPEVRAKAEKKLILDLIDDGMRLADSVNPKPLDLMSDLEKLRGQLGKVCLAPKLLMLHLQRESVNLY